MCNWYHVLKKKWQNTSLSYREVIKIWKQTWWLNDKTIIELGYCKTLWFVNVSQINYLPKQIIRLWQIIDLLATDKSKCFAQPRSIIVNYLLLSKVTIWSLDLTVFDVISLKMWKRGSHFRVGWTFKKRIYNIWSCPSG